MNYNNVQSDYKRFYYGKSRLSRLLSTESQSQNVENFADRAWKQQ